MYLRCFRNFYSMLKTELLVSVKDIKRSQLPYLSLRKEKLCNRFQLHKAAIWTTKAFSPGCSPDFKESSRIKLYVSKVKLDPAALQ